MLHLDDTRIDQLLDARDAQDVLAHAFLALHAGRAAMQARVRTEAGGVKLSTLGAVIPDQDVAGAKVYTTLAGRFSFVILLFRASDGQPLATCDAGSLTRLRTAACSVLAARALARPQSRVLAVLGAGTQGLEHTRQLSQAFPIERIMLHDPYASADLAQRLAAQTGLRVQMAQAEMAVAQADIVVTASRSTVPLFPGEVLKPGAFVTAIGSSLPHTRELDDAALRRAAAVVVEWREQSLREAGDLVLAGPGVLPEEKIVELAPLLAGQARSRVRDDEIFIYKSVGVGLEDIALAGPAYARHAMRAESPPLP
ncbi:ornithine cyclodeaminase [Bordetella ansorpii]|uniref:Ornithine cyclodeaminase n=1 Tax=Bordetella ansorpii TaxID=288768 RepID=A0A157QY45_9BORD|nr:ornithine cyclodeaminase family protein [Bordetella ansorpii]SAI50494.1 ornithine cyclodeaminase [Bordetella ansorpii]